MKLLFITQKVDRDDDLLGVYHEWIAELAKRVEHITVICLMKGAVALPNNVRVYSLGKERGGGRLGWARIFFTYIVALRKHYDVVFVHMNTVYVLLGWWLWRLMKKPVVLWFAHYRPNWQLKFANLVVKKIVTSVPEACAIRSEKVVAIGQGIDTEKFAKRPPSPAPARPAGGLRRAGIVPAFAEASASVKTSADESAGRQSANRADLFKILFLGRISPVKDLETLVSAVNLLRSRGLAFHLDIVGEPTDKDAAYFAGITRKVGELNLEKTISFLGRVPNRETPTIYAEHDLFVNLTATGSFDKSILEAMACELPVVVSNRAYEHIFPADLRERLMFREKNAADLAEKLEALMKAPAAECAAIGKRLREIVVKNHNITYLVERLISVLSAL